MLTFSASIFLKLQWHQASKTLKNVVNFVKHALHVTKTCHVSLTNIHSFVLQTKHFHWSSRYSCLGNCLVWKIDMCKKTFMLHGWTQMVVRELSIWQKLHFNEIVSYTTFVMLLHHRHRHHLCALVYNIKTDPDPGSLVRGIWLLWIFLAIFSREEASCKTFHFRVLLWKKTFWQPHFSIHFSIWQLKKNFSYQLASA